MSTSRQKIEVSGIQVEVVRKDIKNLHLGVYPPFGRVRVAAPLRVSQESIRLAVVTRLGWIRRQQRGFLDQDRQTERQMVTGETHFFKGRKYRLNVVERPGRPTIRVAPNRRLELGVQRGTSALERGETLHRWYRRELRGIAAPLIAQWVEKVGLQPVEWRIKKMKTRWGTCNPDARRIWINLELVKKPVGCLEYIVVHELMHLLERRHNEHFVTLMNQHLPNWRTRKVELNQAPLAHEEWQY